MGHRGRRRDRADRDGFGGDGGNSLVQPSPRRRHRHTGGEQCDRSARISAFDRRTHLPLGLARGAHFVAGMLAFVALVVSLLMHDRPSDLNLPLYGESKITPRPAEGVGLVSLLMAPVNVLKDAARVPIFWVLFGTFFVCGCSTNGLIQTHFITLCHDYGLPAVTAASVLAMMGIFDFFGTIGSGWLSDRFDNRWLLFWYYGLRGLSLLYLPFTDFTFYGLSLFAVFYGLDWIATIPPTVKLTADRFGPEKAGMVFGWVFAGHQIGAASAAFGAGLVRTEYSTYLPAFFVAGALCLIAAALVLTVRKPSAQGIGTAAPARA